MDRVAMDQVGSQSGMAVQGPESSWALGPSCLGGNQKTVVVPLVVPQQVLALVLAVLTGMAWLVWGHWKQCCRYWLSWWHRGQWS